MVPIKDAPGDKNYHLESAIVKQIIVTLYRQKYICIEFCIGREVKRRFT